jgi:Tfp pilus assembly protein PilP
MVMRTAFVLLIAALGTPGLAAAQALEHVRAQVKSATQKENEKARGAAPKQPARGAKTPASAGRGGPAAPLANTDQLIEPPGFAYAPERRRDPFVSLLRRGSEPRTATSGIRPSGLGGLGTEEITLRGTVRSREGFVGILQGADQKTYIVRPGDKLFDGTIRTISQNDLVIVQQVNDPLSLEKQREVHKVLRQIEAK